MSKINYMDDILKKSNKALGLYERTCKTCGKKFECKVMYAYKMPVGKSKDVCDYFCSYTCFRVEERKRENDKRRPVRKVRAE